MMPETSHQINENFALGT